MPHNTLFTRQQQTSLLAAYLLVPLGEVNILLVLDTDLNGTGRGGLLLVGLGGHLVDLGDLGGIDLGGSSLAGTLSRGGGSSVSNDGGGDSFFSS